ncbi:hypothetical protein B0H13DRAFT_2264178 [Mycena leptocephala]|nr:hypothetical protein B0H13DRAFT_2264178 [Mycena leptocephala]
MSNQAQENLCTILSRHIPDLILWLMIRCFRGRVRRIYPPPVSTAVFSLGMSKATVKQACIFFIVPSRVTLSTTPQKDIHRRDVIPRRERSCWACYGTGPTTLIRLQTGRLTTPHPCPYSPALKKHISQSVENDPAIVDRSLSDQLQNLIIKPCRKSFLSHPLSIIIDGLDKCDGEDIQQEILDSIGKVASREQLSILFFIASRPEAHMCEAFSDTALDGFHRPMNIDQSFDDVRKYLVNQFTRIHAAHRTTMRTVPSPWPSSEIVEALLETSSGYFIYASTVVKFVDDKRFRPVDRLNIILGIKNSLSASPFNTLNQLYIQVLCGVPMDFRPQLLEILLVIVEPTFSFCVWQIEELLGLETGDVRLIMRGLHSVINVPGKHNVALTVHHASFTDFLNHLSIGPILCGQLSISQKCDPPPLQGFLPAN